VTIEGYIGVSGFMNRAEVLAALDAFPDCDRLPMVGVLATSKTLCDIASKNWRRYPKREDIAGIFVDDPRCLNLVHVYNDHEWKSTVDGSTVPLSVDMIRAFDAGGPYCHGLQVNAARPRASDLKWFRDEHPGARVVLQVRPPLLAALRRRGPLSVNAVGCLANVTDVLIDASLGKGKTLDLDDTRRAVETIRCWCPDAPIGIAGGLCAESIPSVAPFLRDGLSIDAEGRLRDDADGGGNLDLDKTMAYLIAAGRAIQERR
jgi:hypothetical protein